MLGGGAARGAAQVGVLLALFEAGVEPPEKLIGVSVGALNASTIAAYPSLAGASMLREFWLSRVARDVFRVNPLEVIRSRLRGGQMTPLPASNVVRLIERHIQLTGFHTFERLRVPLQVLATDVVSGRARLFSSGDLRPALQASTAIPAVFPAVSIDGTQYLDGGIVDNMPIGVAVEQGAREVLGIALMAGSELERPPKGWTELVSRTVQLVLHERMLADFERFKRQAKVVLLCPLLDPRDGLDMRPDHVADVIDRTRLASLQLLQEKGRRLFRESAIYHLDLETRESRPVAGTA